MKRWATGWILMAAAGLLAQRPAAVPAGDWPLYARDLTGRKFSPLKQINVSNVGRLQRAWSVVLRTSGSPTAEVTPIVVNGVMYLPAAGRILALEAHTGKQLWSHALPADFTSPPRGVSYWPGDANNPPRILFTNGGDVMSAPAAGPVKGPGPANKLVALNANTGRLDPGFGREGIVDLEVGHSAPPTIFRNLVLLGASVAENPIGPPGDARAYDARTGTKLWEFHTVPRPGEFGNETWGNGSWRNRSGVNMWGFYMTADEERGLLYIPVGGPAANFYGGDRPGDNLFANSLVAVDANTGKYKWHFQTVHHDLWDIDLPAAPALIDVRRNGRTIPALALVGKTGLMFILDRVTGKPIFGVEERPVPSGDVPGEWYSPTQPFPVKPPPLARNSFDMNDLVRAEDTMQEHVDACLALIREHGLTGNGPYTPFPLHREGDPPKSAIQFPGMTGGSNWGGPAADPTTGLVFVATHDLALIGWIEKVRPGAYYGRGTDGSPQPYDRGSVAGPGPYANFAAPVRDKDGKLIGTFPCQRPPWASLTAVNAHTGEIVWRTTLGINEALPPGKQRVGSATSAGPIATAGGLVFIGATTDRRFRAFDARTGAELWAAMLDKNVNANPMTYLGKDGKQYVAVVATDEVVAFALP
jgi:quinoprotein glucose dehydrogenase